MNHPGWELAGLGEDMESAHSISKSSLSQKEKTRVGAAAVLGSQATAACCFNFPFGVTAPGSAHFRFAEAKRGFAAPGSKFHC